MRRLDKSKPYGQIIGEHVGSYEQDGCIYDQNGVIIEACLDSEGKKRLAEFDATVSEMPDAPTDGDVAPPPPPAATGEVNLAMWAAGEQNVPITKVKKVLRERFDKQFGPSDTKDTIIEFLVDEGVVDA